MARIIVMCEAGAEHDGAVTLDERIVPTDLDSGHRAAQLIERVGWAVHDAEEHPSR